MAASSPTAMPATRPPPLAPSSPSAPTVVLESLLHKQSSSKARFLPASAMKKMSIWKPKICQLLSDGTFQYSHYDPASPTTPSATSAPPSSSSDEEEGISFSAPLLPGGALPLSREEMLSMADTMPDHLVGSTVFTLRTRGEDGRLVRLAGKDAEIVAEWLEAANRVALEAVRAFSPAAAERAMWVLAAWDDADVAPDGRVPEDDVAAIAKAANFKGGEAQVSAACGRVQKQVEGRVSYDEFVQVMVDLALCKAVKDVFSAAGGSGGKNALTVSEVATLLKIDVSEASRRMGGAEKCDLVMLQQLLCAAENDACDPRLVRLGDMGKSLSHYFMNSSHNTYLCGDQLTSNSSPAMYRLALEAGCRCVEIDMWDGEEEPCVTHGHTATSKISLRSVLKAIADFGFVKSEWPVVLSLENHLCEEQQVMAARMIREELGDRLHVFHLENGEDMPSPEALKGKLLIKAKMGKWQRKDGSIAGNGEEGDEDDDESDAPDGGDEEEDVGGNEAPGLPAGKGKSDSSFKSMFSSFKHKLTISKKDKNKNAAPKKVLVVAKELADVTSFPGANRKKLTALWKTGATFLEGQQASAIASINESKVESLYEGGQLDIMRKYHARNLTRVYPKGSRVDSSNYNPTLAWAAGAQIVALNFQSHDRPMWLNHGRFRVNGGIGYAPKLSFGEASQLTASISGAGVLTLRVLCGSLLPRASTSVRKYDVADPYVTVAVTKATNDGDPKDELFTTKTVPSNGLSPSWNELFTGHVAVAESNMLLVCVWDEDTASKDDLIGFYSAPVYALRPGIRSMNLCNRDCTPLVVPGSTQNPSIVVEIGWKSHVQSSGGGGSAVANYSSMGNEGN